MRHSVVLLVIFLLNLPGFTRVRAGGRADATWNGGTANWSSAANWSTNPQIPSGDYNAFIDAGAVRLDANYGVVALSIGGGEISGTNARTLTANGLFWWQSGTVSGGMILQANGGMAPNGTGGPVLDGSTLINASNQAVNNNFGGLNLTLKNGAAFTNTGTFTARNTLFIADGGGAGSSFKNLGFLTTNVDWLTSSIGVFFNNSGSVHIIGGNLRILNGSSSAGSYDVDGSGALELSGGAHVLHPGTSFTGVGFVALAGGTLDLDGDVGTGTGNFSFVGGTVDTAGSLTVSHVGFGHSGSTHATITAATLTAIDGVQFFYNAFDPGVIVSLGGTTVVRNKGVSGKFMAAGPSTVVGSGSATFYNEFGAVFDIALFDHSDPVAFSVESGSPTFENAGTFHVNTSGDFGINWKFNNSGTVSVESGQLLLHGGGTSTGNFDLNGGNVVFSGGTHVFNPGTTFTSHNRFGYHVLTGGTLKFGGAVGTGTGDFLLSGGTIDTTGALTVGSVRFYHGFPDANATVSNGTIAGQSGVNFYANATNPGAIGLITGSGVVVNRGPNGSFGGDGSGTVFGGGTASFNNVAGAIFTAQIASPSAFSTLNGSPTFSNAGTLVCNLTNFGTFGIGWAFHNSGTVLVQRGELSLTSGGTSSGTFNLQGGSLIFAGGTHFFNAGTNFTGTSPAFLTGGTLKFGGSVGNGTGSLVLLGGAVDTTGALTVGTVSFSHGFPDGNVTVNSGTVAGQSGVNFNANATNPGAIGLITGSGVVVNRGPNGRFSGDGTGYVFGGGTATFNNVAGAVFTAQIASPYAFSTLNGAPTIANAGTFICNLMGFGTFGIGWTFNNTGVVEVTQGELALNGVVAQYNIGTSTLAGGTWRVNAGGFLDGNGLGPIAINAANVQLNGNGAGFPSLDALATNTGTFTITNGRVFQSLGALSNAGSIVIGPMSLLIATGAFTQSATGSLTIQTGGMFSGSGTIAGTLQNSGLLMLDGPGILIFTGDVTNYGTIRLRSGAVLQASGATSFVNHGVLDLITAGTSTLPPNFTNGPTGIVLTANSVLVKSAVKTGGTVVVSIASFTGHTFQLQRSDGLATLNFLNAGGAQQGFTGATLTFVDSFATGTELFYRVVVDP